jgi:amino acid transporter
LFPLDYFWEIVQEAISELPLPYKVLITLIAFVLVLLIALNTKTIRKRVESHRKKLNWLLIKILPILILCLVAFFTVDNLYSPKLPEDQLVVAISPFCLIDEYGKTGSDINTATDFKERLEAEKDLGIKVIMLDDPIRDNEDAKYQGKKVGAHLVIYGETKKEIGNIGEVKYYILLLPSLEVIPSEMPFLEVRTEEENSLIITEKATFSMVTEEPIIIVESLTQNASSSIYAIGAFENYKKSDFASAINFFKSIKNYDNHSSILFYDKSTRCKGMVQ